MGRTKDYVGYIDYISQDKKCLTVKTDTKEILCLVNDFDETEYHINDIICCNSINTLQLNDITILSSEDFFRVAYLATEEEAEV